MAKPSRPHAIGGVDSDAYRIAVARVDSEPLLSPYEDIIFADWTEGNDHLEWVITAEVDEIEGWAKQIRKDSDG